MTTTPDPSILSSASIGEVAQQLADENARLRRERNEVRSQLAAALVSLSRDTHEGTGDLARHSVGEGATLRECIEAAIVADERLFGPIDGRINREHWQDILARHNQREDGPGRYYCPGCNSVWGPPGCPDLVALARRLDVYLRKM